MKIFEDEPEGLAGEAARTRVFLKLTALYIVAGFVLWNISDDRMSTFKFFALICFLGATYGGARTIYHASTLGVVHIPYRWKPAAQVIVALAVAVVPFFYLLNGVEVSPEVFAYNFTSWALWLTTLIIGYVSYKVYIAFEPLLPLRAFLIAVALVAFMAIGSAYGAFDSEDEYGYASSASLHDPQSVEGKRGMARNYLRIIAAAYIGLAAGVLKMNGVDTRREKANLS